MSPSCHGAGSLLLLFFWIRPLAPNKPQSWITEIEMLTAPMPIIDVVDELRARGVAQYA